MPGAFTSRRFIWSRRTTRSSGEASESRTSTEPTLFEGLPRGTRGNLRLMSPSAMRAKCMAMGASSGMHTWSGTHHTKRELLMVAAADDSEAVHLRGAPTTSQYGGTAHQ